MALLNPKIVDLSHWNAPADLTKPAIQYWDKAKAQGVVGAFIRLGSIDNVTGICYTDYRLEDWVFGAKTAGVPVGYYWYTRPKWGGGRQVDFILKTMLDLNLPMDLDFIIDVEEPGADVNGVGTAPYQARDAIKYMATQLLSKYPGRVGIYTSQYFWDKNVVADPMWATLKLMAARWNSALTSPWSDNLNRFRDWTTWKFWQYSADGNALASTYGFPSGDADIDLSYYNGTVEEFKNEYKLFPADSLQELTQRVFALETANIDINTKISKLVSDNITLQEQINALVSTQESMLKRLIALETWARTINYKQ